MTQANPTPEGGTDRPRRTKPPWLKVKLPTGEAYRKVRGLVSEHKLHTICESGNCPNMGECWGEGTATFMILGNVCTRSCGFCNVSTGRPDEVDPFEPGRVANSVKLMGVKHRHHLRRPRRPVRWRSGDLGADRPGHPPAEPGHDPRNPHSRFCRQVGEPAEGDQRRP